MNKMQTQSSDHKTHNKFQDGTLPKLQRTHKRMGIARKN